MPKRKPRVKATGRLYHKFHGTYWCCIVLIFDSPEHASMAVHRLHGFTVADKHPDALIATATGKTIDRIVRMLKRLRTGDKRDSIDGMVTSIDHGPEFTISVPVEHVPVTTAKG